MMKRKLLIAVLVVILCESIAISGVFLYLLYFSDNHDSVSTISESIDAYKEEKLKSSSYHNIKADIEVSGNTVIIKQEMVFKKLSKTLLAYVPSLNSAETKIKNILVEKGEARFSLKDTILEINCTEAQTDVRIEYEIILNDNSDFLTYDHNYYYLTNYLITPMVYNITKPVLSYKSAIGDPYIYDINNYYVIFKTDKSVDIYAPGLKEEHIFGSNKITIFEAENIRDFPAIILRDADIKKIRYEDIDVYYINSKAARDYVTQALEFAQKNIGTYPYDSLFVVKAPMSQKGMEFSNMIFISDKCFTDKEDLKRVTYHEVLHQWFYGIIGTDQLNEPFFDEGLVNYLSYLMSDPDQLENKLGKSSGKFMNIPLNKYASLTEYYKFAYNDSAAYFYTIHKKLGNNFFRMMHELYKNKKYKMLYFDEFMQYVRDYGGTQ